MEQQKGQANILGTEPVAGLILKYAVPSVVSMLVMALYNIVDQVFIGRGVGYLGNSATTVAFPLLTIGLAISLLTGHGSAASISLDLGRGNSENAKRTLGNALLMLTVLSAALVLLAFAFLNPLLRAFGATDAVMPYALDYTGIILIGMPFTMCATAVSSVIRADGSPRYSMFSTLSGAVLNTILDPIFIFTFGMGVKGAAIATVISQVVSFALSLYYLLHKAKYVRISIRDLKPNPALIRKISGLGSSSFMNQLSMFLVTFILNNSLVRYGALSPYGSEVPLAAVGIVMKINMILISTILGVSIGLQPILGFNYGAKNYARVKDAFRIGVTTTGTLALFVNILFVLTPGTFISIFGDTSTSFNEFARHALSTFMAAVFAAGIQIPSAQYFMATGKPLMSMMLSLTRQMLVLIPMILILPRFFGIDGILYASPVADVLALTVTGAFILREMSRLNAAAAAQDADVTQSAEPPSEAAGA